MFFIFACLVEYHAVAILEILDKLGVRAEITGQHIVRDMQDRIVEDIHILHRAEVMSPGNTAQTQQQIVIAGYDERNIRQKTPFTSVSHPRNTSRHPRHLAAKKPAQQPTRLHH